MKVKVEYQRVEDDAIAVKKWCKVRADGNRGWNQSDAIHLSQTLKKHDTSIDGYIEFIDARLQKVNTEDALWSLKDEVDALKNWYDITGIKYAFDESLAEAVLSNDSLPQSIPNISKLLNSTKKCAALVLKLSVLGLRLQYI